MVMLNEPFRILDNIPLIWCFASFETYQSPGNSNTKARPHWRPTANATTFFSVLSVLSGLYICPLMHLYTSYNETLNSLLIPTCTLAQESRRKLMLAGRGEEMEDEKWGGRTSNCLLERLVEPVWRRDTGGGGWRWRYVINFSLALIFQNKD